ncbi:transcription factor bHLH53 [Phoenix dactylifera]|uniref:Transcription factor bHLH53 n=1 Tax=Phoenix dactylifera TaxID=42345 RepID=A0A8B7BGT5_PHODC|nr:transcription factor bHLH53 [Phoenix dactylifera]
MEREIPTGVPTIAAAVAAEEGLMGAVPKLPTAASFPVGALPFYAIDSVVSSSHIGCSAAPFPDQLEFGFFAEDLAALPECHLVDCLACMDASLKLKSPKIEPLTNGKQAWISPEVGSQGFRRLPGLWSLEPVPEPAKKSPISPRLSGDLISIIESSHKRFRPSSPPTTHAPSPPPPPPLKSPSTCSAFQRRGAAGRNLRPAVPSSEIARQRRKRISDRTRILETLMPWERRMDTGTMLQEAHKYVRFLEAQVTALQKMPCSSAFAPVHLPAGRFGGLELLNRQQLLQVMVNSPVVQDMLYRKGLCVFSAEQVAALPPAEEQSPQVMRPLG